MRRGLPIVLLLGDGALGLACQFEVNYDGARFACADGRCPTGFECVSAICQQAAPPGDPDAAPGAPDAAAPGADAAPLSADASTACTVSMMKDDFTDPALGPMWEQWADPPASIFESGGALVIDLPAQQAGDHYAGYDTLAPGDARGQRISIKLAQAPDPGTSAQGWFDLENPADYTQSAYFSIEAGTLSWGAEGPGISVSGSAPYSATAHRYLALREQSGTVYFETSPDGTTWSVRTSAPVPVPWNAVRVSVGGGTWRAESVATQVKWDDLNGGGAPTGCP